MDSKKKLIFEVALLVVISAVVYLPNIGKLTYFKDDWYYVHDGLVAGAKVFHSMFSIDRPARGYFFEIYYSLFGPYPLPYHIGAYLWRALTMVGAFWLFNLLWAKERRFAFFAALLFGLYPGYFWWVSAIEYQPMIASLAFQVFSIALTIKAVQATSRTFKMMYLIGAVVTGWIYIALVDYAIGMEIFRFLCVYVVVGRGLPFASTSRRLLDSLRAWIWTILVPSGYMVWRLFIFDNERKATDIGLQLSGLLADPVSTVSLWFLRSFISLMNLSVLAWVAQFPRFFFALRLRDMAAGLLITGIVLFLVFLAQKLLDNTDNAQKDSEVVSQSIVSREALFIGLAGMALGIVPIIMANRHIDLEGFSHYALPVSLAAAVAVMGFIQIISSSRVQAAVLSAIVAFAALAHFSISVRALNEESALQKFWWQVNWRVPALEPGTMLVINYPSSELGDDGFGVLEAPNMIYFPQPSSDLPVRYKVSALTLDNANLRDVLRGKLYKETQYRSHTIDFDYANVLVLTQPTPTSCVHVLDGRQPLLSTFDPATVVMAASSSDIENVIPGSDPFTPPSFAFGAEPDRKWCYFFEKADLALQLGKWDEAAALGEEAIRLGLHPEDRSEWFPFLQAYAVTGNEERLKQTASKITGDDFLRVQACKILSGLEFPLEPEIQELVNSLYCRNAG